MGFAQRNLICGKLDKRITVLQMLVHLFGASVTGQAFHHKTGEATGYAVHLKDKLLSAYKDSEVQVTAAPSSHFNDAGYCLLPEVINSRPDILVLEWHTTGSVAFDDLLWRSAIGLIRASNIKTIIAILPKRTNFEAKIENPNVAQARDIIGGNISILNLYSHEEFNPDIHLRDEGHTTPAGGEFYAGVLASNIINILSQDEDSPSPEASPILPGEKERIPSVDKYTFGNNFVSCQSISFVVSPDSSTINPRIILHGKIGPFSPIICLRKGGKDISKISIWDSWCHFTRANYTPISLGPAFSTPQDFQINITSETPAYEKCRDQTFDFTPYKNKELSLMSIYCIGGTLSLVSYT
jgi:hypothetical protein